ncbi:bifunctional DNA primase/polymerase [Aestuariimicrobium sp. p3-SID1156]|uniref:bifunctional DNA primase/polymerase n=1 Tax=Aestuariimicrobium sp. p3-SID1156 TaxID=2916038 RepID=UPI0037BE99FF
MVDVDVHGPHDGRAGYQRATDAGLVDGAGLLVRTPTGGAHVYFPATPVSEQRSWQAATAGVDFRGDGGYIIAPPSRRILDGSVRRYEVAASPRTRSARWTRPGCGTSSTRAPSLHHARAAARWRWMLSGWRRGSPGGVRASGTGACSGRPAASLRTASRPPTRSMRWVLRHSRRV